MTPDYAVSRNGITYVVIPDLLGRYAVMRADTGVLNPHAVRGGFASVEDAKKYAHLRLRKTLQARRRREGMRAKRLPPILGTDDVED